MNLPLKLRKNHYYGTIIEESLENRDILSHVKILNTKIESVTERHKTPWLRQWTLHFVEIPEGEASLIAEIISRSFDSVHSTWYVDFRNPTHHFIIFPEKVFLVNRNDAKQYEEAKKYALALGVPEHQCDFHPEIKEWERELLSS